MRLFVAISLDDAGRASLAEVMESLRLKTSQVRWVKPSLLHLTVKFLGEVADRRVTDVVGALEGAVAGSTAFSLGVVRCGCFPSKGRVRVIWAGNGDSPDALYDCVESVESHLEEVGFEREARLFSPHITLGRVRDDQSGGAIRAAVVQQLIEPFEWLVDSLTLMSSVLSPSGPTYTPIATIKLPGDGQ